MKYQCVICFGQARITHKYLLINRIQQQCIPFDFKFTIKHVLTECIAFSDIRRKHFNVNNFYNLSDIIPVKTIVSF